MEDQKEYSVWAVINDEPKSLLADGNNCMTFEIAIENAIKYLSSLYDVHEWQCISPKGNEDMRWENSKGDSVVISKALKQKNGKRH